MFIFLHFMLNMFIEYGEIVWYNKEKTERSYDNEG